MKPRIKRKLLWERKGVSEVIGTILMLAITVVLFSSIMVWVGNMPTPQGKTYIEFTGTVTPVNEKNWSQGAWINISHNGGITLSEMWTLIILDIENNRTTLDMKDSQISLGQLWEAGEDWSYLVSAGGISETDSVSAEIIDLDKDTLVWNGEIRGGGIWFGPIIMKVWIDSDLATDFEEPGPIGFESDGFELSARIIDPEGDDPEHGLNVSTVWADLTSIGRGVIRLEDNNFDNIFTNTSLGANVSYSPGYYWFYINATDYDNNTDRVLVKFSVGGEFAENPQIVVYGNNDTATNIWTEPPNPKNGEKVRLYATVRNIGGKGANIQIRFNETLSNGTVEEIGFKPQVGMGIGERDVWVDWTPKSGGLHNISVNATLNTNNTGLVDTYPYDNEAYNYTMVFPTILLVDDDQAPNDRGPSDTSNYMMASLEASDFEYDFTVVNTGGNGPGFDYGDYKLEEYDVVIWMTGYEESTTLTNTDIGELQKFLNNSGSIWTIGHGIFKDAETNAVLDTFINNYLQTGGVGNITLGNESINGVMNHPVTDYFFGNMLNLTEMVAGYNYGYDLDTTNADPAFIGNSTGDTHAVSYEDPALDQRIFVQSFEFSMIDNTADQAQLTFKVLKWLGNISARFGRDLAVSEQILEPSTIFYQQNVTITGVIRNNAFKSESQVYWSLTIVSPSGTVKTIVNRTLATEPEYVQVGTGKNNSVSIVVYWTPTEIGPHSIIFRVDPNNQIIETNEDNNQISNLLESGEIDVKYRILVVDDDEGGGVNETAEVTNALDYLGYVYELRIVPSGLTNGPSADDLGNYNAVIWVGGDVDNPLTLGPGNDEESVGSYLDNGGRFWLIGANSLGADPPDSFEMNYLRVQTITQNAGLPATLRGVDIPSGVGVVDNDYFTHGMMYDTSGNGTNSDTITPVPIAGTAPIFYQDSGMTAYNGIRYDNIGGIGGPYKSVVNTFSLTNLADDEAKAELMFMTLHWFEKPEDRAEARITLPDIWISHDNPQLGDSYIIQATVYNPGGSDANVLVRFMDGATQIGSDSISVGPDSKTTAEMVWTPLFAGPRNISVLVDPIGEQDEIFEWFNNNATVSLYVYFFWDDMEADASRWSHESTIVLINGEGALDYLGDTTLYTNITTNWDDTLSQYLNTSTDEGFYNTYDSSAWLQAPFILNATQSRIPIDVVFALDTSGSMSNADIQNMRDATKNFIGNLSDTDRAAIWTFDGGWPEENARPMLLEPYAYMNSANKNSFNASIDAPAFDTNGWTPFYDTVGSAIQYTQDPLNFLPNRLEFVIGMTDGVSNSDDDYTPETSWGSTTSSDPQNYNRDNWRDPLNGLLYSPVMVYTIGLGISHDAAYPSAPGWSRVAPGGALEYDVWNVADSSPLPLNDAGGKYGENASTGVDNVGHYYYTTDSSQLPGIFQSIFTQIQQTVVPPDNVSRAGGIDTFMAGGGGEEPTAVPEPPEPSAIVTIWSDGFESNNFNNWDNNPNDWTVRDVGENDYGGQPVNAVVGGTRAANAHDNNGNTDFLIKSFPDLSSYTNRQLSYWWDQQDLEIWNERVRVDIYHDGGWDNVRNYQNNDNDWDTDAVDWAQEIINLETDASLTAITDWTDVRVRFRADRNMESTDEFMLDDVVLTGDDGGGGGPTQPTIVFTSPLDGETNVPITDNVVIIFSEPMNTASVNSAYSSVPDPGGWVESWSAGNMVLTLTHNNFNPSTLYTINVGASQDAQGEWLVAGSVPNPWSFTTAAGGPVPANPYIVYTYPVNSQIDVSISSDVSVIFSEPMNTATVTYTAAPDPGGWSSSWDASDTVLTLSHTDFAYSTTYTMEITAGQDKDGNPLTAGSGILMFTDFESGWDGWSTSGSGTWFWELASDRAIDTQSARARGSGSGQITKTVDLTGQINSRLRFYHQNYETENVDDFEVRVNDGSGWTTLLVWDGNDYWESPPGLFYESTVDLSAYDNQAALQIRFWWDMSSGSEWWWLDNITVLSDAAGGAPNPWSFTTEAYNPPGGGGGGNGTINPGQAPPGLNYNKTAVTETFDLRGVESSTLSFWHKYNLVSGVNGGVLMVGWNDTSTGTFKFRYVVPSSAYTGNMRLTDLNRMDDFGQRMNWSWNGVSGNGAFVWEKVSLDILPYVPAAERDEVKVKFAYYQYGGGTGYGWYIDDVKVTVSRSDLSDPDVTTADIWNRTTADAHSGNYSWSNIDPVTGEMKAGIDNYLMTTPIDLTNARSATLSTYFKFNLNTADGAPPDGFRVEISKDNGISWVAINLGVRAAWGVSGTGADADDGNTSDGKTYTGLDPDGDSWVEAGTLTRLNTDLSSFSGNAIMIRFRVVTTNHPMYDHDDNAVSGDPGYGGFWMDDVIVSGETILG